MSRYWSNFAKTGNPNTGGDVPATWPAFTGPSTVLGNEGPVSVDLPVPGFFPGTPLEAWNHFETFTLIRTQRSIMAALFPKPIDQMLFRRI